MKKLITLTLLASCTATGNYAEAAGPGSAYINSVTLALNSIHYGRDLTDEEMDQADDIPGGGYSDGKWTGENPPQKEDEDGNPCYADAFEWDDMWEDDDEEWLSYIV